MTDYFNELQTSKTEDEPGEYLPDNHAPKNICERCEKDVDEIYMCEICETMICHNCQAVYNQFSQIDFNYCKTCASNINDHD